MPIFLNWIWQGSALTLVVALVVGRLRAVNAATRERIWWATLASVCAMPLVALLGSSPAGRTAAEPLVFVPQPSLTTLILASLAWSLWTAASAARLAVALVALARAKRTALPFPVERLAGLPAWTRVSSRGRRATLAVSERVATAAVLGINRPIIAVSPRLLDRLSDDDLDNILVHEHAHVQRRDDLGVLAERAVGAVFGWHPAVWWLGRALALEREVACDDLVLTQERTSPQSYARSLVKLVEQTSPQEGLRLAPGAFFTRPQLTRRIMRLLDRTRNASARASKPAIGFASLAIALGVVAMLPVQLIAVAAPALASRVIAAGATGAAALFEPFGGLTSVGPAPAAAARVEAETTGTAGRAVVEGQPSAQEAGAPVPATPSDTDAGAGSSIEPPATDPPAPASVDRDPSVPAGPDTVTSVELETVTDTPPAEHAVAPTPWAHATDAATAVGKASRTGAVRTAGFFTRMGKSIAGAF